MADSAAQARPRVGVESVAAAGPGLTLPTILFLGGTLPKLSETFVYREIFALRRRGVDIAIASVHPPERRLGEPRLDALASECTPVYSAGRVRMLLDAAAELAAHPLASARTLATAAGDALFGSDLTFGRRPKIMWQAAGAMALARRIRPRRIGHIHAHMAHVPTTVAMYAALQLGIGFSFTGHANDLFPNRALLRAKLRRARFVACISRWHRELYRSIVPLDDARVPIVRCGVSIPEEAARPDSAEFRVVGVGRLIPKKGFDMLLGAVAHVRAAKPETPIRCRIVGEGPERKPLQQAAADLGLGDSAEFTGPMANEQVLGILGEADLFVLPCRVDDRGDRDGIPVVLMEAMARGVCVISGDLPAIRELVRHGETGLLVPPGDQRALAAAIRTMMDDPQLRQRLARAGRECVAHEFSSEVNADRLIQAFSSLTTPR